jgi:hypothetical protein
VSEGGRAGESSGELSLRAQGPLRRLRCSLWHGRSGLHGNQNLHRAKQSSREQAGRVVPATAVIASKRPLRRLRCNLRHGRSGFHESQSLHPKQSSAETALGSGPSRPSLRALAKQSSAKTALYWIASPPRGLAMTTHLSGWRALVIARVKITRRPGAAVSPGCQCAGDTLGVRCSLSSRAHHCHPH